jgi:hypothetical protein
MDARLLAWRISLCLGAFGLTACGGGGGGGGATLPPVSAPGGTSTAPPASGPASVAISIAVPSATAASARLRAVRYVSAATKSAVVTYPGGRQVADCGTTCALVLAVNPGMVSFDIALYDATGGTGHLLSSGSTTAAIVAGQTNTVKVTFAGVVAKVIVALATATVTVGTPASIAVSVSAQDAAGYTIVGPDPYATPIALTNDDASGTTALSATTVAAPSSAVMLAYNGGAGIGAAHLGANAGSGVAVAGATLTVASPAVTPPAGASAPAHVKTFAFYGLNDINGDVPAAYVAAHVDIVDDDGFTAKHADAFKRAGGKIALAYTDPTYVPYCPPPFAPPAGHCDGPIGNLVAADESAWMHDAHGARINRFVSDHYQYQEALNVMSASAQRAYAQTAAAVAAQSPLLDGYQADDSGSSFSSGTLGSNLYYRFSAPGVEIPSDQAYIAAETAMLAAAGKPVLINGGDPSTWGPAYNGVFVDLPTVMGQMFEGCFNNDIVGLYTDASAQFQRESDGLLAVQQHKKLALCLPTGDATSPARRLYAYAAFMLTFDPAYSVYGMNQKQSDGESLYPETQLFPQQPLRTATEIGQLKVGGVYLREFGSCSIGGSAIGPCAAVVNTSGAAAAVPALTTAYARHVELDPQSMYNGGKANPVACGIGSLAGGSAAILVR